MRKLNMSYKRAEHTQCKATMSLSQIPQELNNFLKDIT
jgi:hypothetical protein